MLEEFMKKLNKGHVRYLREKTMLTNREINKPIFFLLSCLILTVYLGMIFVTGKPYTDDYARIMMNYLKWSDDGQPLADVVVYALTLGGDIVDIAPMSRVISVVVCALSCLIICQFSFGELNLKNLLISSLVFSTPFFIQNASYHFDVITMCLSIFFAVAPLIFLGKGNIKVTIAWQLGNFKMITSNYSISVNLYWRKIYIL
ncbi:glucosyltransferase domain-containing protein [Arsenophonus endosymbiont of Bemisia tabaci]|uniref:glucosyltransferase domain-containing protein n=1 Tax=Arsenophonus endosymbiont of Bemisia tabaci TaxID=536059 RepID=UPI0015F6C7DB|nr:glucosyltransferase domain-containing protein [Arsenophonus endosymbiont of Bemisia tabaci]